MGAVITYLASPRAWGHLQWTRLDCLCASLRAVQRYLPPWPVVIFHEDYTGADMDRLHALYPFLSFVRVDFSGHESEFTSYRPTERVGTYGYHMMSRFFCGVMQDHPALAGYSHFMRLDDDSYLMAPVSDACVARLEAADYSYAGLFTDTTESLTTLYRFTMEFLWGAAHPIVASIGDVAVHTNWHVSSLALWRNPLVRGYMAGARTGCLTMGWDDAQVGAMLAYLICPVLGFKVNVEREFRYRHNQQGVNYEYHGGWGPP